MSSPIVDLEGRARSLAYDLESLGQYTPRDLQDVPAPLVDQPVATGGDRSRLATMAIQASFGAIILRSGLDAARVVVKLPEAMRADEALRQAGDGAHAVRVRTAITQLALISPNTHLIDPEAPRVASAASAWKSFTRFDDIAYRASSISGVGISGVQVIAGLPNIAEAMRKDGASSLVTSKAGRAGVMQIATGTLGLGIFGAALVATRGQLASSGGALARTQEHLLAAARSPVMTRPWITRAMIASTVPVTANEMGAFAFLDAGEERSTSEVLRDAARQLPLVDRPWLRQVLLGAGVVAFASAAERHVAAGGTLGTLGTGMRLGAAAVAMLGVAEMAGGLQFLDRAVDPFADLRADQQRQAAP